MPITKKKLLFDDGGRLLTFPHRGDSILWLAEFFLTSFHELYFIDDPSEALSLI